MTTSLRALRSRIEERLPRLLRVAAVVLVTLFLSYYLGQRPSILYVAAPLLAIAGWVVLQYPHLGLVALVVSAVVISLAIGTGTDTSLNPPFVLVPALMGFWVIGMLGKRSLELAPSRTTAPLVGFVVAVTIALIHGNLPIVTFAAQASLRSQLGGWGIFVFSAAAFLLAGNHIKDLKWLKLLAWLLIGFGALYFIARTVPGGGAILRLFVRGADGAVFWLWFIALAAGQALFNHQLKAVVRLLLVICVGIALSSALAPAQRGWASGWLPMSVVLFVLILLRWPRLGTVLGALGVTIGAFAFDAVRDFALTGDNAYSLISRAAAAQVVGQIIQSSPLLGVGPANYYWYTPLYSILGYYVRFNSHNQYVDILAQAGVVGLVLFLWFAAETGRLGWRLRHRFEDGFSRAYVHSAIAGLVGMLVAGMMGDWVLPFVYNIGIRGFRASVLGWIFLGGLVALEQFSRRDDASQA